MNQFTLVGGQGEKGMNIKIDVTNAFDRVTQIFLFVVLSWFGFGVEILS